jgi:hypothetical protein
MSNILNAKARRIAYIAFTIVGVLLGTVQVYFTTQYGEQPTWLATAFAVYGYLTVAFGVTAATNIAVEGKPANVEDGSALPADDGEDVV